MQKSKQIPYSLLILGQLVGANPLLPSLSTLMSKKPDESPLNFLGSLGMGVTPDLAPSPINRNKRRGILTSNPFADSNIS